MTHEEIIEFCDRLKQYHFDRYDFIKTFEKVFSIDEILDIDALCWEDAKLPSFDLFYNDDEFYIVHRSTETIINWYKHLGRTNTCNKEEFTLADLQKFLQDLKLEMIGEDKE